MEGMTEWALSTALFVVQCQLGELPAYSADRNTGKGVDKTKLNLMFLVFDTDSDTSNWICPEK